MSDQNDALIELGVDAYTYLYPIVTMDLTRRQAITTGSTVLTAGPTNTFVHIRELPPADFKGVVRPNFDTLYSLAWLDLTSGPIVVSAAAVTDGRYYELPMYDMWTDEFAVPARAPPVPSPETGRSRHTDGPARFPRTSTASSHPHRTCGSLVVPRPGRPTTRPCTRSRRVFDHSPGELGR